MSNINWNQFSNNYNNFNGMNTKNVQNAPLNQTNANTQQQRTPLEVLFPKYISQLSQTVNELAMLNQQQMTNMIRDLLQFPRNFEQLLTQLAVNPGEINQKIAVLLLASNMNITQLSALLKNSSKTAMTNLYQMLAQFNITGMSLKDEQIGQLTKLISFIAASSSSDVQTLRTTMLMYLPWLPLTDPEMFKLEFDKKTSDDGLSADDSITVLISTENHGNIKADIYKTDADGIKIEFISSETFPLEEFKILMKEESKKYSININFDLFKKESFNKKKNEKAQTKIFMNTSPKVNPFLLLISNALIKNIHIIDSRENLHELRKEKINGES